MGLETGTYIDSLNSANPLGSDPKSAGDDHIRLIKSTVKATFPNLTGAVTPTQTELNYVAGVTSAIQTQLDAKATAGANSNITSLTGLTTALSATQGGTAQTTYAQGDILYASGANTLSKLPKGTAGQVLTQGATVPAWTTPASGLTALDVYPVGAVYISVVSTSPATLFGGTWVAFGAGRVLVGIDAGQIEFDTVEKTGGAKTHTLTSAEMPSHTHSVQVIGNGTNTGGGYPNAQDPAGAASTTAATGGGGAHNNLQPYIVCYFWKRTA